MNGLRGNIYAKARYSNISVEVLIFDNKYFLKTIVQSHY